MGSEMCIRDRPRSAAFLNSEELVFTSFGSKYLAYNIKSKAWKYDNYENTWGINAICAVGANLYHVGDSGVVFKNGVSELELSSLCNFLESMDNFIIAGGQSGEIFDVRSGEVIYKHKSPLNCAAAIKTRSGNYFAVGTYTGELVIIESLEGSLRYKCIVDAHSQAVKGICSDNSQIFSVCASGDVCLSLIHI